jgi:hypothetical protein
MFREGLTGLSGRRLLHIDVASGLKFSPSLYTVNAISDPPANYLILLW